MEAFVRVEGRTAEEVFLAARALAGRAGFAVDVDVVVGLGPAVVGALDELGPVMVLAPLAGSPERIAAAASRLARLGAAWITVEAGSGADAVRAAVAAVAGTGCAVAVSTLPSGLGDAEAAALGGATRGKQVSRLAGVASRGGAAGVVCAPGDLGVVAQVDPDLVRIADASQDGIEEWERRGASIVVLPGAGALGPTRGAGAEARPARRRR